MVIKGAVCLVGACSCVDQACGRLAAEGGQGSVHACGGSGAGGEFSQPRMLGECSCAGGRGCVQCPW